MTVDSVAAWLGISIIAAFAVLLWLMVGYVFYQSWVYLNWKFPRKEDK